MDENGDECFGPSLMEVRDGGDCIILEMHSGFGWSHTIYLEDDDAENMIQMIKNKLNGRWNDGGA